MARFMSNSGAILNAQGDTAQMMRRSPFYQEIIEEKKPEKAQSAVSEVAKEPKIDVQEEPQPETQPKPKAAPKRKKTAAKE